METFESLIFCVKRHDSGNHRIMRWFFLVMDED